MKKNEILKNSFIWNQPEIYSSKTCYSKYLKKFFYFIYQSLIFIGLN